METLHAGRNQSKDSEVVRRRDKAPRKSAGEQFASHRVVARKALDFGTRAQTGRLLAGGLEVDHWDSPSLGRTVACLPEARVRWKEQLGYWA